MVIAAIAMLVLAPCAITVLAIAIAGGGNGLGSMLAILLLCGLPLGLVALSLVWTVRHNLRSRQAGETAAAAAGLARLNEDSDPLAVWYGGEYGDRGIALKTFARRERSYAVDGYMTSARFWLRIVMEVKLAAPLGIPVEPGPGVARGRVAALEDALSTEALDRLPLKAQAALYDFVQKGYPTGLVGTTLRTNKGARSIAVYDCTAVPERLHIPADVLPGAAAVLVHDHSDAVLNKDALMTLLDDMQSVARALEVQAVDISTGDAAD
jgi:hypothetical protein